MTLTHSCHVLKVRCVSY